MAGRCLNSQVLQARLLATVPNTLQMVIDVHQLKGGPPPQGRSLLLIQGEQLRNPSQIPSLNLTRKLCEELLLSP